MNQLTISRPNDALEIQLFSVERVMPLLRRYFRMSDKITNVSESATEMLEAAGNLYGAQYITLVEVEPDGMVYLPLHCKRVLSVSEAPWGLSESAVSSDWEPGRYMRGRQWVADQIGSFCCWRSELLESIINFPNQKFIDYQRTPEGIFIRKLRRASNYWRPAVIVIYDAQISDERGWPLLTDLDCIATAHYWNWQRIQADLFNGVQVSQLVVELAETNMHRSLGTARIGEGISEKGWDLILRSKASWDRSSFGYGLQVPALGGLPSDTGRYGLAN